MSRGPARRGGWVDPHAGVPGRRLFVAVPLPEDAVAAVVDVVEEVRGAGLPAGARDVRWVRLDGLHMTLRFLGPTPSEREAATADAVARAASAPGPVPVPVPAALGGAGTFPPNGRPRVLWVGVVDGSEALTALAARVGDELVAAGWPSDDRPFRPHLTLARADGVPVGRLVADRLVAAMAGRRIACPIDRIGLYESITGGGPARYIPVAQAALEGSDPRSG